jgi:hypothetical protein
MFMVDILNIGTLRIVTATLGAIIALVAAHILTSAHKR